MKSFLLYNTPFHLLTRFYLSSHPSIPHNLIYQQVTRFYLSVHQFPHSNSIYSPPSNMSTHLCCYPWTHKGLKHIVGVPLLCNHEQRLVYSGFIWGIPYQCTQEANCASIPRYYWLGIGPDGIKFISLFPGSLSGCNSAHHNVPFSRNKLEFHIKS